MADKKYFHALNASAPVKVGGFRILFECYEMNGTWFGVYSTEDPKTIEALQSLIKEGSHVEEITKEAYERCLKKKSNATTFIVPSPESPEALRTLHVAGPADTVDTEPAPTSPVGSPLKDIDSALVVSYVGEPKSK